MTALGDTGQGSRGAGCLTLEARSNRALLVASALRGSALRASSSEGEAGKVDGPEEDPLKTCVQSREHLENWRVSRKTLPEKLGVLVRMSTQGTEGKADVRHFDV